MSGFRLCKPFKFISFLFFSYSVGLNLSFCQLFSFPRGSLGYKRLPMCSVPAWRKLGACDFVASSRCLQTGPCTRAQPLSLASVTFCFRLYLLFQPLTFHSHILPSISSHKRPKPPLHPQLQLQGLNPSHHRPHSHLPLPTSLFAQIVGAHTNNRITLLVVYLSMRSQRLALCTSVKPGLPGGSCKQRGPKLFP